MIELLKYVLNFKERGIVIIWTRYYMNIFFESPYIFFSFRKIQKTHKTQKTQ